MIEVLGAAAAALAALGAVFVAILLLRRLHLARAERLRLDAEGHVRSVALALVHGEPVELAPLSERDAQALAALLARLARWVSGDARRHVAAFFERSGNVARQVEALSDRSAWRRATAAYVLGDMASVEAVPPLLAALDDSEREVRAAAARSLGRLAGIEAVEPLVFALVDGKVPRAVAGQALLSIGPATLPALRGLEHDPDADVRAAAIELVGLLGEAADEGLLVERLRDSSAEVRAAIESRSCA
jgi:HEAT repeat protein